MFRAFLCSTTLVILFSGMSLGGGEKDKKDNTDKKATKATITKVDAAKNTITLQMKDKEGKKTEKTFELKGDVKMYDNAGKIITIDAYQIGGGVLVIEREGQIMELRKDADSKKDNKTKDKN